MKTRLSMSCLMLAAALVAPVAMAASESSMHAQSSLTAPDVQPMTDEQLKTNLDKFAQAVQTGNASAIGSALRPVTYGGMSLTEEQVKMAGDRLRDLLAKNPSQEDAIKREIFKVENLTIGRTAPNIKGQDTDGVEFQLQDYRGKVVVIDFFGDW